MKAEIKYKTAGGNTVTWTRDPHLSRDWGSFECGGCGATATTSSRSPTRTPRSAGHCEPLPALHDRVGRGPDHLPVLDLPPGRTRRRPRPRIPRPPAHGGSHPAHVGLSSSASGLTSRSPTTREEEDMAVMCEVGFNPDSREWFVQCPKCVEDIPIAVEGMVGLFSATCLTCPTPLLGAVTIASMRR